MNTARAQGPASPKEADLIGVSFLALQEDLHLNLHILQASVVLNKLNIVGEVSIQDLGGQLWLVVLVEELMLIAEGDVFLVLGEGCPCHFEGVKELCAIGEEISPLGAG